MTSGRPVRFAALSNPSPFLLLLAGLISTIFTVHQAHSTTPGSKDDTLINNPFCAVPTFTSSRYHGQARAFITARNKPAIVVDRRVMTQTHFLNFLMAHECCHHELGHMARHVSADPTLNGRAAVYRSAQFELDADCCAAKLLTKSRDASALKDAASFMMRFGPNPTGFGYPNGFERARTIRQCGAN